MTNLQSAVEAQRERLEMKLIDISTKTHPDAFVMVSGEDYDRLSRFKWHILFNGDGRRPYAVRNIGTAKHKTERIVWMHREIMGPQTGVSVDHVDGNGLNNQRSNLRLCSTRQNQMNTMKTAPASSTHKGVWLRKDTGKCRAAIKVESKRVFLGQFDTETDAAMAYDRAAILHFGEFARPNFPTPQPPESELA